MHSKSMPSSCAPACEDQHHRMATLSESAILCHGYTKRMERYLQQEIPDDIISLCAKFRGRFDYIRFLSNSYQLGFQSSISKKGYSTGSAFGNLIIDSMSNKICCWRFRIMNAEANMAFGITDLWDNVDEDCFSRKDSNNYCAVHCQWARSHGEWKKYPFESRKGSIVEMMLNLKRRELSFYVNGQKCGVAFDEIKIGKDMYYKMAICFRSRRSSVKLLEYTESDQEEAMKKVNQKVVGVPDDMRA